MNVVLKFKKVILLTMVLVFGLVLTACKSKEKTPYGDLSVNPYVSLGNISVSERDLYDQLRFQGTTVLSNMIDKVIFKDQITESISLVKSGDVDTVKYFNEKLNTAIFSITNEDDLKRYYEKSPELFYRSIETFVDNIYLTNNLIVISRTDFVEALYACGIDGFEKVDNYITAGGVSVLDILLKTYGASIAQKIYAKSKLVTGENEGDVYDEKSSVYINQKNDKDLVNYYNANKVGKYDVETFVVQFINLNEANAALQHFGLKSDSKGSWYKIPDIRTLTYEDITNDESVNGLKHVKTILEDLKLLNKIDTAANQTNEVNKKITLTDYENYYNKYTISTNRTDSLVDEPLNSVEVLDYFVKIQNLLDQTVELKVDATDENAPKVVYANDNTPYVVNFTYDELNKINASIRTHVYSTLVSYEKIVYNDSLDPDSDEYEDLTGKPYSARLQTASSIRYLAFKLADDSEVDKDILIDFTDEDDNEIKIFNDTEAAQAIKADMLKELIDSKLTDTYITSIITDVYKDVKIDIYDRIVREVYANSYDYSGSTKFKNNEVVAKINNTDITVREFFDEMEVAYGINLSLDILTNRFLESKDSKYMKEIDDAQMKEFKKQFDEMIGSFSNDSYSSNGFPASMGREKFLLLAFSSLTTEDAIRNLYVYPKLRELFYADYEAHFGDNSEGSENTIYNKFAELAEFQYNLYKTITVSHLLIYFDENNDGTPDDPEEFLSGLSASKRITVEEELIKLVELLLDNATNYTSTTSGLTQLATNFQSSGRIQRGNKYYEPTVEMLWSKFRQLGFNVKFESISSSISNTSNFQTGSSTLDKVFYDEAIRIYGLLTEKDEKGNNVDIELPYLPFKDSFLQSYEFSVDIFDNTIIAELDPIKFNDYKQDNLSLLNSVKSSFGYHLIIANSFSEAYSAVYSADDDDDLLYTNEDGLNCYNEASKTLLASQIKYYLKETASDEGATLPAAVQSAVSYYFTPVLTRYQNDYMNREIVFNLLVKNGLEFVKSENSVRFGQIRQINVHQLNEYLLSTSPVGVFNQEYNGLYGSWLDILNR